MPEFDREWKYKGPLPGGCPHPGQHDTLTGTDHEGKWKSPGRSLSWAALCLLGRSHFVHIYKSWLDASSATSGHGTPEALASPGPSIGRASSEQEKGSDLKSLRSV